MSKTSAYGAVSVGATGGGAEGVVATQTSITPNGLGRGLLDLTCLPPSTDWWFVGADGTVGIEDLLLLVNPGDASANVALSFWSSKGPLSPPDASGIVVAPHSTELREMSHLAPDVPGVAFRGTPTAARSPQPCSTSTALASNGSAVTGCHRPPRPPRLRS